MLSITLITVGSLKKSWCKDGCEEYISRINRSFNFEVIQLPASKQKDPNKQKEEESKSILDRIEKMSGLVWVLDETGNEMTSEKMANELESLINKGDELIFVIGGAYGLTDEVRKCGNRLLALSKMTIPHELCRLLFFEQLYRASEMRRGSGYHH